MKKKMLITGRQPLYALLKWPVYVSLFFFYRRFVFYGTKRIPKNRPLIFALNHQNAFLDPLVAAPLSHRKQITFMLRASIYNNKKAHPLLRGINLLPVYRQQDGVETLEKNNEVFENCIFLMEKKRPIFIFPEGAHNHIRSIRSAKKGLARIVFSAEERHNFNLGVCIVPVGINYTDPYNFGSDVLVNVGEPLEASAYKEAYAQNPSVALNQLRLDLDAAMRKIAIDVQATQAYNEIETVREIMTNEARLNKKPVAAFAKGKEIIAAAEKSITEEWVPQAAEYGKLIKKIHVRDYMMKPGYRLQLTWLYALFFISLFPVWLAGTLINYLPFHLPVALSKRMVKDPVFRSSIIFGIALGLFPVYYLLLFTLVTVFTTVWWGLLIASGGFLAGTIALFYTRKWKKFSAWLRLSSLKKKNDSNYIRAAELRKKITERFSHAGN